MRNYGNIICLYPNFEVILIYILATLRQNVRVRALIIQNAVRPAKTTTENCVPGKYHHRSRHKTLMVTANKFLYQAALGDLNLQYLR